MLSIAFICFTALFLVFVQSVIAGPDSKDYTTEDIFIPAQCDSVAKPGDHLLLEYEVRFGNGTISSSLRRPSQLYHILLDKSVMNSNSKAH
jgi:hypothetical protein